MSTAAQTSSESLARGLGWFSIALGAAELLAPHGLARWLGMPRSEPVLQAYGLREIGNGLAILAAQNKAGPVWGRVAGDALDIATLAGGLTDDNPRKENVALALAAVLGITFLDVACASGLSQSQSNHRSRYGNGYALAYRYRSGFNAPPSAMRGVARRDFEIPEDMRTPKALRPLTQLH